MKILRHFITTLDYSQEELDVIIKHALELKNGKINNLTSGKILGMLFFNPSLRTRLSFTSGMYKLGGVAIDLPVNSTYPFEFKEGVVMDKDKIEHIKEAIPVISRYCDAISVRASDLITSSRDSVDVLNWEQSKKDTVIQSFAKYATVPVINMESNVWHPCQGLGDAMTIKEKLSNPKGKKYVLTWAYHPKALPMATANSQILSACDLGMNVEIAYPKGWELDPEITAAMTQRSTKAGGSFKINNNMEDAMSGAKIVCVKSWGALKFYGDWKKEKDEKENLKDWIVDAKKMAKTDNGYFMNCLPVRRNVEVTDDVIDSANSIVIDEAENRMWIQMAILQYVLGEKI